MDIFERAIRANLRFDIPGLPGCMDTTDIYSLPLESRRGVDLEQAAQAVDTALGETPTRRFVSVATTPKDELAQLRWDIVMSIIATKKAEFLARQNASTENAEIATLRAEIAAEEAEARSAIPLADKKRLLAEKLASKGVSA